MWMDLQCPNACGACLGECDDLKDECPGWAAKGECDTNPRFMVEQCPASCDLCPRLQGEALECDSCILMQEAIWRALQPIDRDIEEDPHKSVAEHRLHKRRKSDVIEKADVRRAVGDVCFSHEWLSRSPRRPYHTSCETTVSTRFHDIEAAWLKAVEEPPIDPHAPKIPVPNHPHEKVLQPKPPRLIRPSRTVALAVKRQLCVGNRDHHGHTRSHNEAAGHTDTLGTCNAQRARTLLGMGAPPLKGGACEICRTFVGDAVAVLRRTGLQLRPSGHTGAASPASYKRAVAQLEGVCADFELRHNPRATGRAAVEPRMSIIDDVLNSIKGPNVASAASAAKDKLDSPWLLSPKINLEVDPYHDILGNVPINTYKAKAPHQGKITSVKRIVGKNAPGEVCHIEIDSGPTFRYWEGQSLGVVPPGTDEKGKPHKTRLYSIASTRYGDQLDGNTVSLCVRRAVYWDEDKGAEDPAKKGVCSNYLCDSKPGAEVTLTGPTGKTMLLPEVTPDADLIMVATGTGVAPYRGFLRRLFMEDTPANAAFTGLAWLVLGVPTTDGLLYDDDWQEIASREPDRFRLTYAISREQTTADGRKMYVQDRLAESAEELFDRLDKGAHIYFCGLRGMMPGILETLEGVATAKGLVWEEKLAQLKKNKQWHVEVY